MSSRFPTGANRHSQHGLTLISWIVVIAFLGFQVVLLMNIIPVYLTDNSVKSVMKSMETDGDVRTANTKKIKIILLKKLKINSVYNIKNDNIKIKKVKRGLQLELEYEPRGTLIGNLDYIVTFKHQAIIKK